MGLIPVLVYFYLYLILWIFFSLQFCFYYHSIAMVWFFVFFIDYHWAFLLLVQQYRSAINKSVNKNKIHSIKRGILARRHTSGNDLQKEMERSEDHGIREVAIKAKLISDCLGNKDKGVSEGPPVHNLQHIWWMLLVQTFHLIEINGKNSILLKIDGHITKHTCACTHTHTYFAIFVWNLKYYINNVAQHLELNVHTYLSTTLFC